VAETREQMRTQRAIEFLDRAAGKPWFWPAVGLFPSLDYVLPVLPNQLLMIGLSVLHPKRWRLIALVFVAASALGAFGTAWLIQFMGDNWAGIVPFGAGDSDTWKWAMDQVRSRGLLAVALLALLPVPPRTAVIACAVAGLPPEGIAAAVAAGRSVPATVIAFLCAKAPAILAKAPLVGRGVAAFLNRGKG
jgi:hypothetical protein